MNATRSTRLGLLASTMLGVLLASGAAVADNVTTYHNSNQRHGAYIAPTLTQTAAAGIHLDSGFNASYSGNVYAQPLFYHPRHGSPMVIVSTEGNAVIALDAATGGTIWTAQLPASVPNSDLPCGNINPEGITGTPVIDAKTGTMYLDALTLVNNAPTHQIFALDLNNKGAVLSGWPVSVDALAKNAGQTFTSYTQGNRSGALLFNGNIYFSYAGRSGDCGTYHGTVVQIDPSNQSLGGLWQTRATGGGIWAQGGTSSDGQSLFATTGNTMNADNTWQDGEAILRLKPGLAHSADTADYYAPSNWQQLDNSDKDLGGTEAIPLNVFSGAKRGAPRVIAFGKDGNAYLVDRTNLGGIGGQIAVTSVSNSVIITAPAVYSTDAMTMVAFTNFSGQSCSGNDLTMLTIAPSGTNPITTAWCQAFSGAGAPMVTTTDGTNNPIVWVVGAEGDNELHGYDAVKGTVLFGGSGSGMQGLRHFQTLISAEGRIYVGADNKVYAFTY